jgi:ribosome maturation factor RimP
MQRVGANPLFAFYLDFFVKEGIFHLSKVVETVEKLVTPVLEEEGVELVEVQYKKEGPNWFLRVFIDGIDRPVDLDLCTRVSEQISELLDQEDPIPHAYILEVSSAGAERPLKKEKDFVRAVGKHVHVTTYEAIEGKRKFEGLLVQFADGVLVIEEKNGKQAELPLEKVAKARLAIVF